MTAANEKPVTCPCCGSVDAYADSVSHWHKCDACECEWDESKRRLRPTLAVDKRWHTCEESSECAACDEDASRAQAAEAVDEAKEREAFEKWCKQFSGIVLTMHNGFYTDQATQSGWIGWLARARG